MTTPCNRAATVCTAAFSQGKGAFQCIQYCRSAYFSCRFGQQIAAVTAATRADQSGLIELFQEFADRGWAEMCQFRQFGGRIQTPLSCGQAGQNHGGVIGQFADA